MGVVKCMNENRSVKFFSNLTHIAKIILFTKGILILFSFVLAFTNFLLFLIVVMILNIPLLRKSIFGRLPTDTKELRKSNVLSNHETYEYLPGLFLDVFYPPIFNVSKKSQHVKGIVLFAHGGGWISGYRRQPNNISWYR